MENDIPKIDLPDDWIIGNLSHKDIGLLSLYANYPCRYSCFACKGKSRLP